MRHFKLTNARGETLDLASGVTHFFYSPEGLGFTASNTYKLIGNRYIKIKESSSQKKPSGTMIFAGSSPYASYQEFIEFCGATPLTLLYKPLDTTYYMDCILSSIDKGEITKNGDLECKVSFDGLSKWYSTVEKVYKPIDIDADSSWIWGKKTGAVEFSVYWSNSDALLAVQIDSDSNIKSPCKLIIQGPCNNPIWKHYVDGKLVNSGSITLTMSKGQRLVIDNTCDNPYIYEYTGTTVVRDCYPLHDFSQGSFIELQYGRNMITVNSEDTYDIEFSVEANILYESV